MLLVVQGGLERRTRKRIRGCETIPKWWDIRCMLRVHGCGEVHYYLYIMKYRVLSFCQDQGFFLHILLVKDRPMSQKFSKNLPVKHPYQ